MSKRKAHWEQIYSGKSPLEVSWYQSEPEVSLNLINNSGITHEEAIIDVGGGASVLVDRLNKLGYDNLSVLDISAASLAHARQRLGTAAHQIEWIESDITEFRPSRIYQLWHDRAVFHFLTESTDRARYVNTLNSALAAGGHLIIAAFAIGGPEKCSGLDIVQYNADKLHTALGDGFDLLEEISETHITPAGKEQLFSYFHFAKI